MSLPDLQKNYFQLFDLPVDFQLDQAQLGERYRQLQKELHPDRYASASAHEQRLAVQYSALINEAYASLRKPLPRALYLLELAGMSKEDISGQQIDGGFFWRRWTCAKSWRRWTTRSIRSLHWSTWSLKLGQTSMNCMNSFLARTLRANYPPLLRPALNCNIWKNYCWKLSRWSPD